MGYKNGRRSYPIEKKAISSKKVLVRSKATYCYRPDCRLPVNREGGGRASQSRKQSHGRPSLLTMCTDGVKVVLRKESFSIRSQRFRIAAFESLHLVSVPGIFGVEQLELFRNLWPTLEPNLISTFP